MISYSFKKWQIGVRQQFPQMPQLIIKHLCTDLVTLPPGRFGRDGEGSAGFPAECRNS